jgi:hypothetical protein
MVRHMTGREINALKRAKISLVSCIHMIEKLGQGDTCGDLRQAVAEIDAVLSSDKPTRGGPTEAHPDAPYCKPDQSYCDFCCGN